MSDGSFKITTDDQRKLIVVTYTGEITIELRKQAVQIEVELLEQHGYSRLLVDLSNSRTKEQDIKAESEFAGLLGSNEAFKHCKTAYLTKPGQYDNTLIEILARAKHFNCQRFTDIEDARRWLAPDRV